MSCYMTLSEVLPSLFLISFFVYWLCYIMPETWDINSVIHRSYSPYSWKVLPHFLTLEKCCIRIRNLSAVFGPFDTAAEFAVVVHSLPSTHVHTHALTCILYKSQWFLCSWCTSTWKGDWNVEILSFVVSCFCICAMRICDGKMSSRSQTFWKAQECQQMQSL